MDNVKFWDRVASKYDKSAQQHAQTYADTVMFARKYLKDSDHVLDFACGTGLTTVQLAGDVKSVHAVDISPKMVEAARSKCEKAGVTNVSFDCATLFDEQLEKGAYDAVLAFNVLFALPEPHKVFARFGALLKPDGMFISVTDCLAESSFRYRAGLWVMAHLGLVACEKLYSRQSLKEAITAGGFDIIEAENLCDSPPNLFIAAQKCR